MSNAKITTDFLAASDAAIKDSILKNIGTHYGITSAQAYVEVTHDEAESLLEYMTGPERFAASRLMQRHMAASTA